MITLRDIKNVDSAYTLLELIYSTRDITEIPLPIDIDYIIEQIEKLNSSNQPSFDDWDKSGYIKVNRGENKEISSIELWVNPSEVSQRQRFTKAHEIGHLVHDIVPQLDNPLKGEEFVDKLNRGGVTSFIEVRANKFAAQLLMPLELVKIEVNALIEQVKKERRTAKVSEAIEKLAPRFDVSTQSMEFRLKNLGYIK